MRSGVWLLRLERPVPTHGHPEGLCLMAGAPHAAGHWEETLGRGELRQEIGGQGKATGRGVGEPESAPSPLHGTLPHGWPCWAQRGDAYKAAMVCSWHGGLPLCWPGWLCVGVYLPTGRTPAHGPAPAVPSAAGTQPHGPRHHGIRASRERHQPQGHTAPSALPSARNARVASRCSVPCTPGRSWAAFPAAGSPPRGSQGAPQEPTRPLGSCEP